jgi:hypothetical protein
MKKATVQLVDGSDEGRGPVTPEFLGGMHPSREIVTRKCLFFGAPAPSLLPVFAALCTLANEVNRIAIK